MTIEVKLTDKQKEILQHTLGADSRYKKKQWGFRNHFCAGEGHADWATLMELRNLGLMRSRKSSSLAEGDIYFHATSKGMKAIGFNNLMIIKTLEQV